MTDLWNAKGYGHLGLKSQNLRDQASRLEKIQEGSVYISLSNSRAMSGIDESMYGGGTKSASNIDHSGKADLFNLDVQTAGNDESRYANSQETPRSDLCTTSDLHTTSASVSTTEIPRDAEQSEQTKQNDQDNERVLGCLPEHNIVDKPAMITWGIKSDGSLIVLPTTIISRCL